MTYKKKGYKPWNKGMNKEEIKSHYKNGSKQGSKGLVYGLASMRKLIRRYKSRAKERGLEYDLTEEQFKEITQKNCYYCGAKPKNKMHPKTNKNLYANGEYIYNGIDRIDNKKGYSIDNVVPCCKICNVAKNNLTQQKFKNWIEKVYDNIIQNKSK